MVRLPVVVDVPPPERLGRVHLIGIGGAGLSAIARLLVARGVIVSGSDAHDSDLLAALRELGIATFVGHATEQVRGADTVIVSTAVRDDNPELVEARRLGLRLLPRSSAIASLGRERRTIAVAGTHGKTTTTSMLAIALQHTGSDPSYAIGAELTGSGANAHNGSGDVFVVEADESDGAFLHYEPYGAIVTNVDADHLDHWGSEAAYRAGFDDFVRTVAPAGFVVFNADDPGASALAPGIAAAGLAGVPVGIGADRVGLRAVDVQIDSSASRFGVRLAGKPLVNVVLQVRGRHYVLDALAALGAGLRLGHNPQVLAEGLGLFAGAKRRMELKGSAGGVTVFDSYAHHPVEIAADLRAARDIAGDARIVACFQPHLVSRTRLFGAAMGASLSAADEVVVSAIYLAREQPQLGVSAAIVADAADLPADRVHLANDLDDALRLLVAHIRPGDLVLTLGAGDVTTLGPRLLSLLGSERTKGLR